MDINNRSIKNCYPFLLFAIIFLVYIYDDAVFIHNDATANIYLPVSILKEQNLSYSINEFPFMFLEQNDGSYFHRYYLTPGHNESEFINTFGPGPGLTALPLFFAISLFDPDFINKHYNLWYVSRLLAGFLSALSGLLLFLIARKFTGNINSTVICLTYTFATCIWSYNSQSLFQHTCCNFFLILGIYFLVCFRVKNITISACSLAISLAVLCRPTTFIFLVAIGIYLILNHRKYFITYIFSSLPVILFILAYNLSFMGSPLNFGQTYNAEIIALLKTGNPDIWQTPIFTGISGILFSPARGVFVYSPVLVFSVIGFYKAFRVDSFKWLKYLVLASILILITDSKWFDWWGGWCFGYRIILETIPVFVLALIPVLENIEHNKGLMAFFVVTFVWSVFIQVIGAYAYDTGGWDKNMVVEVKYHNNEKREIFTRYDLHKIESSENKIEEVKYLTQDIDKPEFRNRLWSFADNPIIYYLGYFQKTRKNRHNKADNLLSSF